MDIMMIGSLQSYTKTMKMQMKWQQKKASGNYTADKTVKEAKSSSEEKAEALGLKLPENNESTQMNQKIRTKMASGKKLTSEEMEFLKENDPQAYQKAKATEMERQAYEQELKRCRTKEEVQRVKLSHSAAVLSSVKNIETDPHIPKGAKLGLAMQELARNNALEETCREYMKSGNYKRLPTEAERRQAEEEMEKAKKAELGIDDKTDQKADEVTKDRIGDLAEEEKREDAAIHKENEPSRAELKEARETAAGHEKTRMEAEATFEARKVRRAKAQAAYAKSQVVTVSSPVVDVKVE